MLPKEVAQHRCEEEAPGCVWNMAHVLTLTCQWGYVLARQVTQMPGDSGWSLSGADDFAGKAGG